jgi:hypothetical protein
VDPITVGAAERDRLVAAARQATQRLPAPEEPYLLVRVGAGSDRAFLVVGMRFVRLGAPIGLYAFRAPPR